MLIHAINCGSELLSLRSIVYFLLAILILSLSLSGCNDPISKYEGCPDQLVLINSECVETRTCADEPCLNDAICVDDDESFTCECPAGYAGETCAINVDECEPEPCENGGVCKEKDTCECVTALSVLHEKFPNAPGGATGWQGTDCTMPICVQGYVVVQ